MPLTSPHDDDFEEPSHQPQITSDARFGDAGLGTVLLLLVGLGLTLDGTAPGGAVSQLPLHEYRSRPEREMVTPATPLWWLLNEAPEPSWTASAWKQWIVRCVKLRGDQHTEILRRGADVVGLRVHHPDAVVAARVNGRLRYACRHPDTQEIYGVDQDDMLHFPGFGFDGVSSMSAIK